MSRRSSFNRRSKFIFESWLRQAEGVTDPASEEFFYGSRHEAHARLRDLNSDTQREHNVVMRWVEYA